jgi:hypothetical protein
MFLFLHGREGGGDLRGVIHLRAAGFGFEAEQFLQALACFVARDGMMRGWRLRCFFGPFGQIFPNVERGF